MKPLLAALCVLVPISAQAKEWTWTAYNVAGGKAVVLATGSSCNYQTSVSAGRKAAEAVAEGAFMIKGAENLEACPKAVKKPG